MFVFYVKSLIMLESLHRVALQQIINVIPEKQKVDLCKLNFIIGKIGPYNIHKREKDFSF